MALEDRASLSDAERAQLTAATARHGTLADVIQWGVLRTPAALVTDVIVQDEFTHDVIVPLSQDRVLVYDTT